MDGISLFFNTNFAVFIASTVPEENFLNKFEEINSSCSKVACKFENSFIAVEWKIG